MLSEIRDVRQIRGEGMRRWFMDSYFDLIVWYDDRGNTMGFQLCYDKPGRERAFTWRKDHGCRHERIDTGEIPGRSDMTPVIASEPSSPDPGIVERFVRESERLDPEIVRLVHDSISRYATRTEEGLRDRRTRVHLCRQGT